MKKIFLIALFAVVAGGVSAQGIRQLQHRLAVADSIGGARVEVTEEASAAAAIAAADNVGMRIEAVDGYRVSLFRDNKQTSGEDARAVAALFREHFPEIAVSVSYESPYFKVAAGNFLDRVDAIALQGKALVYFPKAVVITERNIPVGDIIVQPTPVRPPAGE
ncbi:MAG: hypothetical protein LBM63_04755 [Rikenellaceae bacterium]|jgi:hypothetical protein|nr:hypothetical protein [Rikenellaceae bacterium]